MVIALRGRGRGRPAVRRSTVRGSPSVAGVGSRCVPPDRGGDARLDHRGAVGKGLRHVRIEEHKVGPLRDTLVILARTPPSRRARSYSRRRSSPRRFAKVVFMLSPLRRVARHALERITCARSARPARDRRRAGAEAADGAMRRSASIPDFWTWPGVPRRRPQAPSSAGAPPEPFCVSVGSSWPAFPCAGGRGGGRCR
jgi:hypothetical protein